MEYIRKTERLDIYLQVSRGIITIQQKWFYNWLTSSKVRPWTYSERVRFHKKVDHLIWGNWGNGFTIIIDANSELYKKHRVRKFKLEFDVKWVLKDEHWSATVTKIRKGSFQTSSVEWNNRKINFDSEDLTSVERLSATGNKFYQKPVVHEFGHAIGNSIFAVPGMHADEYKETSSFSSDYSSIMNIGSDFRSRHIDFIILELKKLIPDTNFRIVTN